MDGPGCPEGSAFLQLVHSRNHSGRQRETDSFLCKTDFFDATINEADLLNLGSWKEDLGAWALVPCKAKNKSYFVIYILQFMG